MTSGVCYLIRISSPEIIPEMICRIIIELIIPIIGREAICAPMSTLPTEAIPASIGELVCVVILCTE